MFGGGTDAGQNNTKATTARWRMREHKKLEGRSPITPDAPWRTLPRAGSATGVARGRCGRFIINALGDNTHIVDTGGLDLAHDGDH